MNIMKHNINVIKVAENGKHNREADKYRFSGKGY
jgi:hypothetical protein